MASTDFDRLMQLRTRKFCCVSYCSEEQILDVIHQHWSSLRGWAYALHDKDVNSDGTAKEPHFHVILWLYNDSTCLRIRRWFRCLDSNFKEITTTASPCQSDIVFAYEYLWHRNDPQKYQYDESIVVCSNPDLFTSDNADDNAVNALNDILSGVSLRDVMQRYGRDFIYHYSHVRQILTDIKIVESGGDPFVK